MDGGADPVGAPPGARQLDPQDLLGLLMSQLDDLDDLDAKAGKPGAGNSGVAYAPEAPIPGLSMDLSGL